MDRARVVVGVDGSEPGTAALRWAATEAWLRDVELEVLAAYRVPSGQVATGAWVAGSDACEIAQRSAAAIVDDAVAEAREIAPHAEIRGHTVLGPPAPALIAASRDAALVVVGNRGRGGFRSLLLGSVSVQVATHSAVAVAVVRGRANRAYGPVMVGFDGSVAAEAALASAFEEAAVRRRGTLVALTAFQSPLSPWSVGPPPMIYDEELYEAALRRELTRQMARWREKYPTVTVDCALAKGTAAGVLVERSRHAQLIVVGTRGRGGFSGLLLGSVGLHLLHHSDCPVLISRVRQPWPETARQGDAEQHEAGPAGRTDPELDDAGQLLPADGREPANPELASPRPEQAAQAREGEPPVPHPAG